MVRDRSPIHRSCQARLWPSTYLALLLLCGCFNERSFSKHSPKRLADVGVPVSHSELTLVGTDAGTAIVQRNLEVRGSFELPTVSVGSIAPGTATIKVVRKSTGGQEVILTSANARTQVQGTQVTYDSNIKLPKHLGEVEFRVTYGGLVVYTESRTIRTQQ